MVLLGHQSRGNVIRPAITILSSRSALASIALRP